MKGRNIILAPTGFPWRSTVIGLAVQLAGMGVGLGILGTTSIGGTFVVAAIIANGAFCASLG